MADAVIRFFEGLSLDPKLMIFIISMIPIVELRGAIPVAIKAGLSWYEAFGYAFLGSVVVAPILLLILMPILKAMKKTKAFRWLANAVENLFQSKAESVKNKAKKADSKNIEDIIKMVGVFLFVAIPLPLTGVWTGTAVAVFLGLGFWKSLVAVAVGNVSAGLIMTGLSLLFKDNLNLFLTIFMIVILVVLIANIVYLVVKSQLKKKKAAKLDGEQGVIDNNSLSSDEQSISNANELQENKLTTMQNSEKVNTEANTNVEIEEQNSTEATCNFDIKDSVDIPKVTAKQVNNKEDKN